MSYNVAYPELGLDSNLVTNLLLEYIKYKNASRLTLTGIFFYNS